MLHIACLNNIEEMAAFLLAYLTERTPSSAALREWINSKTEEGYSAMHFASFRGNTVLSLSLSPPRRSSACWKTCRETSTVRTTRG